jgi:cysteine-rich repeat protein
VTERGGNVRLRSLAVLCVLAALPAARPADAAFHLMNIVEVFTGTPAAPGAQYVVLQMWDVGQNFVAGHTITFYDRFGGDPVTFTFGGNVPNGANQDKIFIANAAAQGFFNLTPDLLITGTPIRPEGGKICFEVWDCVAWGNYAGDPAGVGTPFARPTGLVPGHAMRRRLDVAGGPTTLDAADDTHDSANDFRDTASPAPRNNARQNGTIAPSICANNVLESLEECDDGNAVPDDGCTNTCTLTRLFADGLESADTSRWHAAATGTGDLTVTAEAALAGSFGLQGSVNDTQGLFVQNDSPDDEDRYRARFYFDPNGFDPGEALDKFRTRILIAFEEGPARRLMAVVLRRQAGQYALMARARRDDNSQANTGFVDISDGPHWVELDWRRSTTDAGDGSLRFWIDGELRSTLTDLQNRISQVDFVRLGALSVKEGAVGTIFWDHFDSRRETAIGPFVP